jgi:hypothetical protein
LTVHTLEPELRALNAAGDLDDRATEQAVAIETGQIFSLFAELHAAMYVAVAMIVTGVGWLLKNNFDRIGPLAAVIGVALVAAGCYFAASRMRRDDVRSLAGDYVLLLAALLVSADVGFAETQFHWLGVHWSWHLLLLACWHTATAYLSASRLVLSVALTSLAAWFGIETGLGDSFGQLRAGEAMAGRALACAALLGVWRLVHSRLRGPTQFCEVLEHYAINLGFLGSIVLCAHGDLPLLGSFLLAALAILVIAYGRRVNGEMWVAYGVIYSAVGICIVAGRIAHDVLLTSMLVLISVTAVAILLWRIHGQMHDETPGQRRE